MGRSLKKGPFVDPKLYAKVEKQNAEGAGDLKPGAHTLTIVARDTSGAQANKTTAAFAVK